MFYGFNLCFLNVAEEEDINFFPKNLDYKQFESLKGDFHLFEVLIYKFYLMSFCKLFLFLSISFEPFTSLLYLKSV